MMHYTTLSQMPCDALKVAKAPPTCTPLQNLDYLSIGVATE